ANIGKHQSTVTIFTTHLCLFVIPDHLNLGKKISIPKDVMMEELNVPNRNRGSRMFQERQKRVEKFTLENNSNKTVAKKGSPGVLAPGKCAPLYDFPLGYSGPLKEIPHERFNTTVIPKSYCSPWRQALASNEELLNTLNSQLPENPQGQQPANYRSFNRAAVPFGGMMASRRVVPVIGFEAVESQTLPGAALDHMCQRPNFNRAPRGWGINYSPESNEL
uniref:Uncharacterized protein n=1 Tax=Periophthalmus magnuspinnatus TaxID=409849 RepID=A0A3B4AZ81_9GOBI